MLHLITEWNIKLYSFIWPSKHVFNVCTACREGIRTGRSACRFAETVASVRCHFAATSSTSPAGCGIPIAPGDCLIIYADGTPGVAPLLRQASGWLLRWVAASDLASGIASNPYRSAWYRWYYTLLLRISSNASSPRICMNISSTLLASYTRPCFTSSIASR